LNLTVMAGLDPAIYATTGGDEKGGGRPYGKQGLRRVRVDGRVKPGHDGGG